MPNSIRRNRRDGAPIIWFLLFSLFLNVAAAVAGFWIHLPNNTTPIMLTEADMNDAPPLGSPDAPEEQPPADPQPTPPPEPEPIPPPLDKPPEFELPEPTPTPAPPAQPQPTPKPKTEKPKASPNPNAAATPGQQKGFANGVVGGTGNGGPRSGLWIRCPKPSYPPQAMQLHITGNVMATITVSNGQVTSVHATGPSLLASAAERHIRSSWQGYPTTNGTFTLPIAFVLGH